MVLKYFQYVLIHSEQISWNILLYGIQNTILRLNHVSMYAVFFAFFRIS